MKGVVEMEFSKSYLDQLLDKVNTGEEVDITGLFPTGSDVLTFKDGPAGKPDICTTKVTLNKRKSRVGPITIFNIYENGQLVISEFYYKDQQKDLLKSLYKWLTI